MRCRSVFPIWRHPDRLANAIAGDLVRFGNADATPDALAVTMTGELADCFADRAVGVRHIATHVCGAAKQLGIETVSFYGVDGRFRDAEAAIRDADLVAAANWHALASFVAGNILRDGILIDIGSTTTDIIPIRDGRVATAAATDYDRLLEGSLVYVGCRRTPVCALLDELSFRGRTSSVMNELFATIDDARVVLGVAPEDPDDSDTADGMPRTRGCAANRLARMIGLDRRSVSPHDAKDLAIQVVLAAKQTIRSALGKIPRSSSVVVSGHGEDLIDLPYESTIVQLSDRIGWAASRCAPSYAVAALYMMQRTFERNRCDV